MKSTNATVLCFQTNQCQTGIYATVRKLGAIYSISRGRFLPSVVTYQYRKFINTEECETQKNATQQSDITRPKVIGSRIMATRERGLVSNGNCVELIFDLGQPGWHKLLVEKEV